MDFSVDGTVFFETRHALRLSMDETEAEPGMFQRRAFGQIGPAILKRAWIGFGQFPQCQMDFHDARCIRALKYLFEDGFDGMKSAHGLGGLYPRRTVHSQPKPDAAYRRFPA